MEVGGPACGRGLEPDDPGDPFQPKQFYDSVICDVVSVKLMHQAGQMAVAAACSEVSRCIIRNF